MFPGAPTDAFEQSSKHASRILLVPISRPRQWLDQIEARLLSCRLETDLGMGVNI